MPCQFRSGYILGFTLPRLAGCNQLAFMALDLHKVLTDHQQQLIKLVAFSEVNGCVDIARLGPIAAWRGTMGRSAPYRSIPITVPERHSACHGPAQKPITGCFRAQGS